MTIKDSHNVEGFEFNCKCISLNVKDDFQHSRDVKGGGIILVAQILERKGYF